MAYYSLSNGDFITLHRDWVEIPSESGWRNAKAVGGTRYYHNDVPISRHEALRLLADDGNEHARKRLLEEAPESAG